MLDSIKIQGFRKYKRFELRDFGRINFILGNNNVGKTSVLEAIYAWACGQNIAPFINIPLARARFAANQQPYWLMEEIISVVNDHGTVPFRMSFEGNYDGERVCFNHIIYPSDILGEYDSSYKIITENPAPKSNGQVPNEISSVVTGVNGVIQLAAPIIVAKWDVEHKGNIVSGTITSPSTMVSLIKPYKSAKYIDVLSHTVVKETVQMYSSLKRENKLDDAIREIGKIYPEIAGFDTIPYPDGSQAPISVVKKDGSMLPLYACGDGIQRWFYIIGAISLYKNTLICIDEIDTGFHPNAQYEFCKNLSMYAKSNNVQLFITTHNIEFVDGFLDANKDMDADYLESARVITLRDYDGEIRVRTMNAIEAEKAREDYKMELR